MLPTEMPPRRPKTRPRRPTKLSRRPKDTKTPSRGSKTPPRPPKIPPRPLKTAPGSAQEPPEVLINWRGGTKAQPSSIRRPTGYGVLNGSIQVFLSFQVPSPWTKFLTQRFWELERLSSPSLIPPHWALPTLSYAAICGVFASWRLLSRKSRVPRGLQKPIKF